MPALTSPPFASKRRIVLPFDPARDGFSFANSFAWTDADLDHLARWLRPLSVAALAALGGAGGRLFGKAPASAVATGALAAAGGGDALVHRIARRWRTFGLCGGMALAAIERFESGSPVPTSALQKDAMRSLLRRRQAETLRHSLPRFVREWTVARWDGTEHPPLGARLGAEVERATRRLESGRPVILGLVGDSPDPFANHQVVAFGVERGEHPAETTFFVYDPNAPGVTRHIRTALVPGTQRTAISTDLPTGRRANGRCHLSTRPGWLASVFVVM
ncbi:MAG: hypothetical protein AAGI52_05090 [Bacteroidota bacterium]